MGYEHSTRSRFIESIAFDIDGMYEVRSDWRSTELCDECGECGEVMARPWPSGRGRQFTPSAPNVSAFNMVYLPFIRVSYHDLRLTRASQRTTGFHFVQSRLCRCRAARIGARQRMEVSRVYPLTTAARIICLTMYAAKLSVYGCHR